MQIKDNRRRSQMARDNLETSAPTLRCRQSRWARFHVRASGSHRFARLVQGSAELGVKPSSSERSHPPLCRAQLLDSECGTLRAATVVSSAVLRGGWSDE